MIRRIKDWLEHHGLHFHSWEYYTHPYTLERCRKCNCGEIQYWRGYWSDH